MRLCSARSGAPFSIARARAREGHLPVSRQLYEMISLLLRRGIGPGYYQVAGFWRREIPWSHKLQHIGARTYARRLEALNPLPYRKISQYKLSEKALLQMLGLPTPRFCGHFDARCGRTPDGEPLATPADLKKLLGSVSVDSLCFKEMEGWGGRGFKAVVVRPGGILVPHGENREIDAETYCREVLQDGSWLIEEYLEQHEWYASMNPSSVNTLRIWLVLRSNGEPNLAGALLRIGRAGSIVDNTSVGGLASPIDIETGVLGAAVDNSPERPLYATHPDSGRQIEGEILPQWTEAKELAVRTLRCFPHTRFAGMDIALTPGGPTVIELNVAPDQLGAAKLNIPTGTVLVP